MTPKNDKSEYENFDRTMQRLLQVPHSEIKKKLDEEKQQKKQRTPSKSGVHKKHRP
jgi:hypothetical protein